MGIGDSLPRRLFIVDDNLLDLFYSLTRDFVLRGLIRVLRGRFYTGNKLVQYTKSLKYLLDLFDKLGPLKCLLDRTITLLLIKHLTMS